MIIKSQLQSLANISCLLLPALACIADVKLLCNQQHVESATQAVLLQNYCSVHLNRNNDLKLRCPAWLSTHYTAGFLPGTFIVSYIHHSSARISSRSWHHLTSRTCMSLFTTNTVKLSYNSASVVTCG